MGGWEVKGEWEAGRLTLANCLVPVVKTGEIASVKLVRCIDDGPTSAHPAWLHISCAG